MRRGKYRSHGRVRPAHNTVQPTQTIGKPGPPREPLDGALIFWVAVGVAYVLHQVPLAFNLDYILAQFGTWAHELGHCSVAVLLGGQCDRLEVLPSTGGTAYLRHLGEPIDRVAVYAAGILAPAFLGGTMLIGARRFNQSRSALLALSALFLMTALLWSGDEFTLTLTVAGTVLFALAAFIPSAFVRSLLAQLVAIFLCLEAIADWSYAYVDTFDRGGEELISDTGLIARLVGGPQEFWATLVCAISAAILIISFFASRK
ncbi:MAG: M50 family metallopeptidase [Pseudomonadota bacterium]